jgi:predicted GNAT superfamily acetyltransferase
VPAYFFAFTKARPSLHRAGGRIGEIDASVLAFDQSARYDSAKFSGSAPAIRVSST